jgi:G3E family GTPase
VLGDELGQTLVDLVERNPDLEAIVLETTGVAEPLPIAWAVAREPVNQRVRLAAVVTLLDARNFLASRPVSASVDAQIAYADVILVTKATPEQPDRHGHKSCDNSEGIMSHAADAAEAVARQLAPRALIRRGTTDDHAGWLEAVLADPAIESGKPPSPDGEAEGAVNLHHHTDECRHLDSSAAHGIDSVWIAVDAPVDLEELEDQLAELPANYVRIKGIIRAKLDEHGLDPMRGDAVRWVAVHRVGPRVSSEPVAPPTAEDLQQGRIVALGPSVRCSDLARCVANASLRSTE